MNPTDSTTWDTIKAELIHLLRSFIAALAVACVTAAMNWLSVHIPDLIKWIGTISSAYAASKYYA